MKILITSDWYAPAINGVVTSVLNLQRELSAQGHDVRVLTLSRSPRSYCSGAVTYIGAISAGKIYPDARFRTAPARHLLQQLINWSPDVIHTQCEFSTFLMAKKIAAATGAPIVHTYHTVYEDYTHYFSPSRKWGRRAIAAFSRWIIARTACVIAPTDKVRALLERYQVNRPIYVIPSGIDLRQFTGMADAAAPTTAVSPEALVRRALELRPAGSIGLAFTYNEPLTAYEYVRDCARLAHAAGLKTVLVTNGCFLREPLEALLGDIDAMFRVAPLSSVAICSSGLSTSTSPSALMSPAVTSQGPTASI